MEDSFITLTYTNRSTAACRTPSVISSLSSARRPGILASQRTPACILNWRRAYTPGLYFQEDKVLWDMVYDWVVFWSPMEALLAGLEGKAAAEDGTVAAQDGYAPKNDNDGTPT
jgi:hypothetical protein